LLRGKFVGILGSKLNNFACQTYKKIIRKNINKKVLVLDQFKL